MDGNISYLLGLNHGLSDYTIATSVVKEYGAEGDGWNQVIQWRAI